jgi:uncharacterized membrane protein
LFRGVCGFGGFLKDVINDGLLKQGGLMLAKIEKYRSFFMTGNLILILIASVPTLALFIRIPTSPERFSELWLLDSERRADDYPFNVRINEAYTAFMGVGDHLGYSAYYKIYVKFRNQTQSAPNSSNSTPSSLPALFNITAFVADERVWELPLTFSFDYSETLSQVEFYSLTLNDVVLDMRNYIVTWDSEHNGFFGNLFFELWLYGDKEFQYHNRFVGLWLNMTV